ncbi:peptidoglycan recognition protein family protein [Streptomyces sp. KR80]|uniref:peptidoglycan recognition protein family protein n=1 Tax=Streptomyces sp. KR80 TaxID=3457426 RepID=UPI003FD543F2
MRALLASSIGVACTAALALPLALPSGATAAHLSAHEAALSGSTQSLPLVPLPASDRTVPTVPDAQGAQGISARGVRPFSLLGVVWKNPDTEFHGSVQVRTRAAATGKWSPWRGLQAHIDHAPDPSSPERRERKARGSTAPLWVGASNGVEVRAVPQVAGQRRGAFALPAGLRLELVHPGDGPEGKPRGKSDGKVEGKLEGTPEGRPYDQPEGDPGDEGESSGRTGRSPVMTPEEAASSAVNAQLAPMGAKEIKPLGKAETESEADYGKGTNGPLAGRPFIGPRPRIVTRAGWGAAETLRDRNFLYTRTVKAAFIHHSATGNNYTCKEVPAILRAIYRYHVKSSRWRDFGYNFAIDKCGTIYEGRAGGVAKPVQGAHTLGFNSNSMGIAVLGSFSKSRPPAAAVNSIAKLTAWKLGLFGVNPRGKTSLVSAGSNKYRTGSHVRFNVISGHRDGFVTDCPGRHLYSKLFSTRMSSAKLQGR